MDPFIDIELSHRAAAGRIAVVMAVSMDGDDGMTALIRRLHPDDRKSVYIVAAPGCGETDGSLVRVHHLASDELTVAQGCLCCGFRSELNAFLGQLFMSLLTRRERPVKVVFVLTKQDDHSVLEQSITHASFLAQRYAFCGTLVLS